MNLQLLIEGSQHQSSAQALLDQLPQAQTDSATGPATRGLDGATIITIFGVIAAGGAAIKSLADAGLSVAQLAKFLLDWKREHGERQKTILRKTKEDKDDEILVLEPLTELEEVERFLAD